MIKLIFAAAVSFIAAIVGGLFVGGSVYYGFQEFFPALEVTYAQSVVAVLLWGCLKLSKREVDAHEGDAYELIWGSLGFDIMRAIMMALMVFSVSQIF